MKRFWQKMVSFDVLTQTPLKGTKKEKQTYVYRICHISMKCLNQNENAENLFTDAWGKNSFLLDNKATLKAHLRPNSLATVCYCFQMVLWFFSRSDWLSDYSCERKLSRIFKTNQNSQLAVIYFAKLHQSTTSIYKSFGFRERHLLPKMFELSVVCHVKVSVT